MFVSVLFSKIVAVGLDILTFQNKNHICT